MRGSINKKVTIFTLKLDSLIEDANFMVPWIPGKLLGTKKLEVSSPRAHMVCVSQAPGAFERIDAIRRTFVGYDFDDVDVQFSQKKPHGRVQRPCFTLL